MFTEENNKWLPHVKFLTLPRILKYPYALIIFRSNFFNVSLILLAWHITFFKNGQSSIAKPTCAFRTWPLPWGLESIFLPLETTWDFETVSTK